MLLVLSMEIEVTLLRMKREEREVRELSKKRGRYELFSLEGGNRAGNERSHAVRILDIEVTENPDRCYGRFKAVPSLPLSYILSCLKELK